MCNANNFISSVQTLSFVVKNHLKREKNSKKKIIFSLYHHPPPPDTPRIRIRMKIFARIRIRKKKCGSETLKYLLADKNSVKKSKKICGTLKHLSTLFHRCSTPNNKYNILLIKHGSNGNSLRKKIYLAIQQKIHKK